ncbi:ML domain-containing protein [Neohortaea acidophila]|uniref:Phosphatidylglycerol/phosphatidylinositol transfer protein n=1 Tax=Neohortaea acidophila TaxID=245834 RepID=A0A6A6PYB3_9PEZI|nr:ML domain-containing protein [Neohortaea acidophila]KAF2484982.1 ML domain-containing protein [Neohortaea acidophila]
MKLLLYFLPSLVAVQAGWLGASSELALSNDTDVPGENPLKHCADPKDDILDLESVDISPNPPLPGTPLKIVATGNLTQKVEEGATIALQVKYGLITIIKQTADLCETVKNVDLKCPLEVGELTIEKEVDLPKVIPPGKYHVIADVQTKDDEKVTCLTADVEFKRGGGGDALKFKQDM